MLGLSAGRLTDCTFQSRALGGGLQVAVVRRYAVRAVAAQVLGHPGGKSVSFRRGREAAGKVSQERRCWSFAIWIRRRSALQKENSNNSSGHVIRVNMSFIIWTRALWERKAPVHNFTRIAGMSPAGPRQTRTIVIFPVTGWIQGEVKHLKYFTSLTKICKSKVPPWTNHELYGPVSSVHSRVSHKWKHFCSRIWLLRLCPHCTL